MRSAGDDDEGVCQGCLINSFLSVMTLKIAKHDVDQLVNCAWPV